jgi:hypothetical protein
MTRVLILDACSLPPLSAFSGRLTTLDFSPNRLEGMRVCEPDLGTLDHRVAR